MATIKPTLNLSANSADNTTTPGPMSTALALSVADTLSVDLVDHFTYPNVRTTYQATDFAEMAPV